MIPASKQFQVAVRYRPLSTYESQSGQQSIVELSDSKTHLTLKNPKPTSADQPQSFAFDHIYGSDTSQEKVYQDLVSPLIQAVTEGQNVAVLTYGKPAAGKTYTMVGKQESQEQNGIIPRACEQLFNCLEGIPEGRQATVTVSHYEVCSEEIKDLLVNNPEKRLELREQLNGGIFIKDLTSTQVKSYQEVEDLRKESLKNRSIPHTRMNMEAYMGHAIFTITVQTSHTGPDMKIHETKGRLTLVDLAGSENFKYAGDMKGAVIKQAIKTNNSLTTFDQVITALANAKTSFVPYRNSKLTRVLQDSLDGSSKTIMIANITPAESYYTETLATLKIAQLVKKIVKNDAQRAAEKDL